MARGRFALATLLLATVGLRLAHLDQPIVENYVGRQIPTAMVARNLQRGSGFFRPQIDTGPFPNLFLVEPPIFASCVAMMGWATSWPLGASGRAVSAIATGLAAWGVFGLVRRREGLDAALIAVAAFGLFPITVRYGRACQPDMLMLGLLVAGMRLWDDFAEHGGRIRLTVAWASIALGLAVKIVAASVLIPLVFVILHPQFGGAGRAENGRQPRSRSTLRIEVVAALLTPLPALLWYALAAMALRRNGSRASADNAAIWASSLGPLAMLRSSVIASSARFLIVRAFTPVGFVVAAWGFLRARSRERLWIVWALAATGGLAMVGGKLHHEYYWLALAPAAAALGGSVLAGRLSCRAIVFVAFAALALWQSASTFRTPPGWANLSDLSGEIGRIVPRSARLVAPEAVLFAADRRGCRLEFEPAAMTRAAGEWGGVIDREDRLALVEFYRRNGARFLADLTASDDPPERRGLHEAIRRRYNVRVDRDGLLIAELSDRPGIAPCPPSPPP